MSKERYRQIHNQYHSRAEYLTDVEGEALGDIQPTFTGTYTEPTSEEDHVAIPDPVPPYVFCLYSTEIIVQIDPPVTFTPGALLNHPNIEHEADWIQECTRLQGRAFQQRCRGPDADVVALLARGKVSEDLLPDDLDERIAERDLPAMVARPTAPVAFSSNFPPCMNCLQYRCMRDCEGLARPVANNLHKTIVQASQISGYGLFAVTDIPGDTLLCEYVGEVLYSDDTEMRNFVYVSPYEAWLM